MDTNLTTGATDAICGRKTTAYTVCRDASCTTATNIPNVVFVAVSGAENYNIQTGTLTGGVCPAGQTCVRVYEIGTQNIDDYATGVSRQEDYDDIVKWVTLDELRTKVGCQGSQLKITNNELSPGFRCSNYTASIYAEGGVPFSSGGNYRWCIEVNNRDTAPGGLSFSPNIVKFPNHSTSPTTCSGTAEASWGQANTFAITSAPYERGSFSLTMYVRDNNDSSGTNDNITQKSFVLTVGLGENRFRVWNATGATRDFIVDGGTCRNNIGDNNEITNPSGNIFFDPGETIGRYTSGGTCGTFEATLYYSDAVAADTDCDFKVDVITTGTGFTEDNNR